MARRAEPREAARLAWDDTKEARRVGEELSQVVVLVDMCVLLLCIKTLIILRVARPARKHLAHRALAKHGRMWPRIQSLLLDSLSLVSGAFPLIHKTHAVDTHDTQTHPR